MRTAAALLCLTALVTAQDVRIKVEHGLAAEDFVRQVQTATGGLILYAPKDLENTKVEAALDVTIPRESVHDFFVFALKTCELEIKAFDGPTPLTVVLPSNELVTEFRVAGSTNSLQFNRGPGSWRTADDMAGALAKKSVTALIDALGKGDPAAATLLGYTAPRKKNVVDALTAALNNAKVADRAAWALGRCGYYAKDSIPALKQAIQAIGPKHANAIQAAVRTIEQSLHPAMLDPKRAREVAPEVFKVKFETTKGTFVVEAHRDWSPLGVDRFFNLVRIGFFENAAFFRVVNGLVQFGKSGDPRVNKAWFNERFADEPVTQSNQRGYLSYAKRDRDTRTTQLFVNTGDNSRLDKDGFTPFAVVTEGMNVLDSLYSGYGESPDQGLIHWHGNAYLKENFPKLDSIKRAVIVK